MIRMAPAQCGQTRGSPSYTCVINFAQACFAAELETSLRSSMVEGAAASWTDGGFPMIRSRAGGRDLAAEGLLQAVLGSPFPCQSVSPRGRLFVDDGRASQEGDFIGGFHPTDLGQDCSGLRGSSAGKPARQQTPHAGEMPCSSMSIRPRVAPASARTARIDPSALGWCRLEERNACNRSSDGDREGP